MLAGPPRTADRSEATGPTGAVGAEEALHGPELPAAQPAASSATHTPAATPRQAMQARPIMLAFMSLWTSRPAERCRPGLAS